MTLLTLVLLVVFVGLGRWQWHRGEDRKAQWELFEQGHSPWHPSTATQIDSLPRFGRVAFAAEFLLSRQFLLDNRTHRGKPGYEVLTPAMLDDGTWVLVNRGWVPYTGYRDRLPDVSMSGSSAFANLAGRVDELPSPGLASGRAPPDSSEYWPKLTSFPTHDELERTLGKKIARRIVLLNPELPGGYVREWSPPGLAPERHFSYAIQWWGFAVVLLVLYFGLNFRKVK
jgi:cytochrome oxidase assembly protein ShyY1